ncbi:ABC transporter permease [Levilactobacillus tujiorum]|uniref:Putative hemin transport system permease protein HrtB n=1 Tax=Levilactobacillus tujiorum TaxID=2912243 RepID=A0ABX1L2X8_9LACO|nr:ABC transporter permease [Levilactobacillus tujiorum]MCH5464405.1 ABC transporter permease [Levilactobacillus tujiorum]NLR11425.1 ABC transporter permease [Lactobacillus sp. HBUAS51387]NLR29385.1 ABC transporter permease [Levilactobacillus tujiorum]
MFLALKEIRHEKLRYGLIIGMIVLVSYLVFVLSGLAYGLAQQNTQAISSWRASKVVLNADANNSLAQSLLTKHDVTKAQLTKHEALIGQAGVVAKAKGKAKLSAQFLGIDRQQLIYQRVKVTSGHKPHNAQQIMVDDSFKENGYHLGERVTLNSTDTTYQIVGFTHNAKLSVAPVIYGTLGAWRTLSHVTGAFQAGGIVSDRATYKPQVAGLQTLTVAQFINKLPGYSAQNTTFTFMIGFLMIIAMVVIAVFLYILAMQKLPNYAVLRAQGIPAKVLVTTTISQALILVVSGLAIGAALTAATVLALPVGVPMSFNLSLLIGVTGGILLTGIVGALIPVKVILNVDPVSVMGG